MCTHAVFTLLNFVFVSTLAPVRAEDYNICLLTESQISEFVSCGYKEPGFEKVNKVFDDQLTRFPGISASHAIQMVCKSSGDDGDTILEEFKEGLDESDQHLISKLFDVCLPKAMRS